MTFDVRRSAFVVPKNDEPTANHERRTQHDEPRTTNDERS